MNPLEQLASQGQAFWLDYIRRGFVRQGELERLVRQDGLRGVTSNPAIFEKALASPEYREQVQGATCLSASSPQAIFDLVAVRDVRDAADVLRPVYDATAGADGFVSLEVSPTRAHDTENTLADARRLWAAVNRPNLMIKVPATPQGIPAIEELIAEGINVNVTLLFSVDAYIQAAEAYLRGLTRRLDHGLPVEVASVASFFVSRIDTAVDKLLEARGLHELCGKTAIANAKNAYRRYQQLFSGPRWERLAQAGARVQRLLWASTGVKNPAYSDVLYVEELIGPDTVNTMPPATADAFRDHGRVRTTLTEDLAETDRVLAAVAQAGISLDDVTSQLLDEGVKLFADAFDKLLAEIPKVRAQGKPPIGSQAVSLPAPLEAELDRALDAWQAAGSSERLWRRDPSLWTGRDEGLWLAWLGIVEQQFISVSELTAFGREVRDAGFDDVVVLGMGGSSLCPEVLAETFGRQPGFPRLRIVDSTDPGQIAALEATLDPRRTLFIVASKSGSTLEPNIFKKYFFARQQEAVGADAAPAHFVAITDPGSPFEAQALSDRFRRIFYGLKQIGGRFSALSNFGMVPAAAMGIDVYRFLERAEVMTQATGPCVPARDNPAVVLGAVMGLLANQGRNKLTLVASPGVASLGAWLEQLIAESTGKVGKAIIPVDGEPLLAPAGYGDDRYFVYIRHTPTAVAAQDSALATLSAAGFPVVTIQLADVYDLGQEFFRWEVATAVAGTFLGINPFDQPDVEASKIATRAVTTEFERTGALPPETPLFTAGSIRLFADPENAAALKAAVGDKESLECFLAAHLARIQPGDYFALLAYLDRNPQFDALLQQARAKVLNAKGVATCVGFGPRFLHSTGQAYKGGPNTGVFLQITADDPKDLPVPGQSYTFSTVKAAQALGDLQVLSDRHRRALRVHLGAATAEDLATLVAALRP